MKTQQEIEAGLAGFYGTELWHRFSVLFTKVLLTDGAKYLADNAECYWFFDIIGSVNTARFSNENPFQVWKVTKLQQGGATVICDDGNSKILYTQKIPYTDFPLTSFDLFATFDGSHLVCMLKTEY